MNYRLRKLRFEWMRFRWWLADEWWAFLGGLLWMVTDYREAYYRYREDAWRDANGAVDFPDWLRAGGWRLEER